MHVCWRITAMTVKQDCHMAVCGAGVVPQVNAAAAD